ncbi:Kidney mitochondrial carrier protein 1 [Seminavis robusta]|uniref:Kidney mitochondrial carrier protein 1 n=1 Tax=Seminavis robusta TaxID=568900 RepID=A0A9N8HXL0_9STRA|nr:Kidney mitochondrial carrier protein 1 [Seminavis robusta]|eukprot:Sro1825_g300060.1 Kidney mitochondrial carrier protein 1 (483) ;mRNA; r:8947-10395
MLMLQGHDTESLNKLLAVQAPPLPQWQSFIFPAVASTMAAPFSNPFGVAKTQAQLIQGKGGGILGFFRLAISTDPKIIQRGLFPVMMRETSQNLFRIGAYQPIMDCVHNCPENSSPPAWKRMVAGGISGALGFFICNPFEIVRTKVQAQPIAALGGTGIAATPTVGPYRIAQNILETGGTKGFFRAGGASVALGVVCTSVNLTSYTLLHEHALEKGYQDTPAVDMTCALISGFVSALAMNPIDVVRTRLFAGSAQGGMFQVAYQIFKTEGPSAFMKGFVPSFLRIGPHFVLTFAFLEQMRRMAKDHNLQRAREAWILGIFKSMDQDGNGEIDEQELQSALQAADPSRDSATAKKIARDVFVVADYDKSGSIDLDEFTHAACTQKLDHIIQEQQRVALFRSLDTDGNGFITEDELLEGIAHKFQGSDERTLQQDMRRILQQADTNNDGKISFEELCAVFDSLEDLQDSRLLRNRAHIAGVPAL